jgi:hypothetical protein
MAERELMVHEIEYLGASNGTKGDPPHEQKVVIVTVRPDAGSFRPHNLGVSRKQAVRLFEDLKTILARSAGCLLVLLVVAGCSGEVEIEQETTTPMSEVAAEAPARTVTKDRTRVAVDLLADHGPIVLENGTPVETLSDGTLVVDGCVHLHQTLIIHLGKGDRHAERAAIEIIREWTGEPCVRHRLIPAMPHSATAEPTCRLGQE